MFIKFRMFLFDTNPGTSGATPPTPPANDPVPPKVIKPATNPANQPTIDTPMQMLGAPLTPTQMYDALNKTYTDMGYQKEGERYINDETLPKIGLTSPNFRNKFIDQLVLTLNQRMWVGLFTEGDDFARAFSVDIGKNGWGMLDTFQQFLEAATPMWDPAKKPEDIANDLVTPVSQELSRKYYDSPIAGQIKNTINIRETEKLFTPGAMNQFVTHATAIMAASAEYFLMTEILKEIKAARDSGDFVKYNKKYALSDKDSIQDFLADVRGVAKDMTLPTRMYNADSVLNNTIGAKTYIITNHVVNEYINAKGLSNTYNLDLSKFNISTLFAPYESEIFEETLAIVLDKRALIMGIRTYMMTHFRVQNALWENYWFSIEGMKGHNRFFSAVVFDGTINHLNTFKIYNTTSSAIDIAGTIDSGKNDGGSFPNITSLRSNSISFIKMSGGGLSNELSLSASTNLSVIFYYDNVYIATQTIGPGGFTKLTFKADTIIIKEKV